MFLTYLKHFSQPFAPTAAGGRNFVIPEKKDKGDKFGNIVQAKQEMVRFICMFLI